MRNRDDYFWFDLVFIKKIKLNFFYKKNEIEPEPKLVQTDQFQFGFLGQNRFKPVWLGFFRFGFGSVWFFQFQAYKTETEPNRSVFSKF